MRFVLLLLALQGAVLAGCTKDRLDAFGDVVAHADEVRAVAPSVTVPEVLPTDGRPLTASERAQLEAFLRDGVITTAPNPPRKCLFDPLITLTWRKGAATAQASFCFKCCEVAAFGTPIQGFSCDGRLKAWATEVMKTVPRPRVVDPGF